VAITDPMASSVFLKGHTMSETTAIEAKVRDRVGKGAARELRREGLIPAVIYGDKKDPLPIAVSSKEMTSLLHAGGFLTTVTSVSVDGKAHKVLPKDYQLDPVKDFLVHIDFLRISAKTRVTVEIPVTFINEEEAPGIKRGGVLNVVRYAVELECPADAIPDGLIADLTGLDIGDGIHISAISLPDDVTPTITDRDFTVATIAAPAGMQEEEEEVDGEEISAEVPTIAETEQEDEE
jgi:large subunit ribosomal protein L25